MLAASFYSLALYCLSSSITPGPNNLMLAASGANFGYRRTVPHMLGIMFGYALLMSIVAGGLGVAVAQSHAAQLALEIVGAGYMLYLAYRVATAAPPDTSKSTRERPFSFLQAALFQWVNPKGWIGAIGAVGAYSGIGGTPTQTIVILTSAFFISTGLSVQVWTLIGTAAATFLTSRHALRVFNWTMAAALVASIALLVI